VAGRMTRRRAAPDGGGVSANVKRVIALGVTQFAAFAVVLAVGWSGGPGHPEPIPTVTVTTHVTQTATATVTQTKTEEPKQPHSQAQEHTPTPDVGSGGSQG
jgi:hypothetical protein